MTSYLMLLLTLDENTDKTLQYQPPWLEVVNDSSELHITFTRPFVIGENITINAFAFKWSWFVDTHLTASSIVSCTFVDIWKFSNKHALQLVAITFVYIITYFLCFVSKYNEYKHTKEWILYIPSHAVLSLFKVNPGSHIGIDARRRIIRSYITLA